MKVLLKYHLYFIGLTTLIISAIVLNWGCPPNYDEAHAWNIAQYLSLPEIFTLSKIEGHPFLWYCLLMPFAKIHFLYPYSLYLINLILIVCAFYLLYKYAPFPTYLKYLITFSAPFLQLYSAFARSYTLGIALLFATLTLYPNRHRHGITYLILLLLLANTNLVCFFGAFALGVIYLYENIRKDINNKVISLSTQQTIIAGLLELILIIIQFYGYDTNIPKYTPTFSPLQTDINNALHPLNIYIYILLLFSSIVIFIKYKRYTALYFLIVTQSLLLTSFLYLYHGSIHHHNFFYIYLICAFWLSNLQTSKENFKQLLPLIILSSALIFNPANQYKLRDKAYLTELQKSALHINNIFPHEKPEIIVFEHFDANIILPYLKENITLLNQTTTDFKTLKGFQESLYHFYIRINIYTLEEKARQTPTLLLFRTCEKPSYYRANLAFHKKYQLSSKYCLYTVEIRQ